MPLPFLNLLQVRSPFVQPDEQTLNDSFVRTACPCSIWEGLTQDDCKTTGGCRTCLFPRTLLHLGHGCSSMGIRFVFAAVVGHELNSVQGRFPRTCTESIVCPWQIWQLCSGPLSSFPTLMQTDHPSQPHRTGQGPSPIVDLLGCPRFTSTLEAIASHAC